MDFINGNEQCFISTLARLRESSKEAVVSADFSDSYTMYMHVDRPVQDAFISVLKNTYESNHSELILLCGSVGDGKSHMLSYCNEKFPEIMTKFRIHNDSTASLYIDKSASYTLHKLMSPFSDSNLEKSNQKLILAINLGTLSNFLESDTENAYSLLKKYVAESGILDEQIDRKQDNKFFHSVNFADYHLYELTTTGPKSKYIKELLNRIVINDSDNMFFRAYSACCKQCAAYRNCPVRVNYELLNNKKIQDGIVSLLIENIVKNKLIVSTRALLNMIYEIIVDERSINRGSLEPRKEPEKLSSTAYCEGLLPNLLFSRNSSSDVLDSMRTVDPMRVRNEQVDDFFIMYENTDNVIDVFDMYLAEYHDVLVRIENTNFSDPATHSLRESVLRLLIRLNCLVGDNESLLAKDVIYDNYMKALFDWNTGHYKDMKNIYTDVAKGVLLWNGKADKNEMQIEVVNKKSEYRLVQEIEIKPVNGDTPSNDLDELSSFRDELKLKYKYAGHTMAELDVDFSLYELLQRVIKGYVPSINDKRLNVKCEEFVKKISRGGSKLEKVYIRDLTHKEPVQYVLSFDEAFGYSFEVE